MVDRLDEALTGLGSLRRQLSRHAAGRDVYLVGGTVRDVLLGREPADYDFAVSGSGLEFARDLARRTRGKLVVLSGEDDEARVVSDGRVLDFNGFGSGTIEDDVARRDFTINALACPLEGDRVGGPIDRVGGIADLDGGRIRPVSESALARDPLRLLRAIRFALELGFAIDDAVWRQGREISLGGVAGERLGAELLRIMERPGSHEFVVRLAALGRLAEVLPDLSAVLEDPRLREHTLGTYFKIEELVSTASFFSRFEPEWKQYFDRWGATGPEAPGQPFRRALLKLAGLLHDLAKPETRFNTTDGDVHFYGHDSVGARRATRVLTERLRLSRNQIKMVRVLVQEHMRLHLLATSPELTDRAIRRFFRDLDEEAFGMMILCLADGWATAGRTFHLEDTITRMINQKRTEDEKAKVIRFVTGHDLIALGLEPGPAFKVILQELQDLQLEGKIGSREDGIEYLRSNLPGLKKEGEKR